MWSSKPGSYRPARRALRSRAIAACGALAAAMMLSGCGFQPLYATQTANGPVSEALTQVDIAPVPGRVGQQLRNELIFKTQGGGSETSNPNFRLTIALRESTRYLLVQPDADSLGQVFALTADFTLTRTTDNTVVMQGKSLAQAAFERTRSIYSNQRARRDAENRAARSAADDIRTRLAAYFARQG